MKVTDEQLKAINKVKGNVLVQASPGSGKTSVFVARIANLINHHNVDVDEILGLTFTKDAAENMRRRLSKVIGKDKSKEVYLTTFHSFALAMLKKYTTDYSNIKIVEPWFENQVANDIVKPRSYHNKDGQDLGINAASFLDFVSYQKTHMVKKGNKVIIDEGTPLFAEWQRDGLQNGFNTYCTRLENARKKSFDDMLLDFYYLLLFNDDVSNAIKNKYKIIQVDEGQDTSVINLEILKLIENNNVAIFQDINQSIFSFQGASAENAFNFIDRFDDVEVINLPHNFRSTNKIISACNDVLSKYRGAEHQYNQFTNQKSGRSVEGEPVEVTVYNNIYSETQGVVDKIEEMMSEDSSLTYDDFAIISRTNNGLLMFENELSNREIPVIISSGRSFYDRREIDDLLSYAKLYLGQDDDAFRKVANKPNRYIANAMIRELEEYAFNHSESLEESARGNFDAGRYTSGLNRFLYDIEDIREVDRPRNAEQLLREIYNITGYRPYMEAKTMSMSELADKKESVNSLFMTAKGFKEIEQFLAYISVVKDNQKKNDSGVTLTTVHSAKGLEWKVCFVIGATDNNYPHKMLVSEDKDEELRLLFVAMSRAKDRLFMSLPVYDGTDDVKEVSRFIEPLFGDRLLDARNTVLGGVVKSEFEY